MKKLLIVFVATTLILSCKTDKKEEVKEKVKEIVQEVKKEINYPEALKKVLEKHGGLDAWKKAKTLSYSLNEEVHTVDLHSRKTLVTAKDYSLGFDGKEVWVSQKDSTAFKKDPKFYYNLFFYFYAMPFVLADDGIVYNDVEPLVYEDVSYPGIKIGYQSNVGMSPEDNYFIYYNPETFQMEWLGYTVTYFSKEVSKKVKMIRYDNWEDVNGFLLPKSINWFKNNEEDGTLQPTEKIVNFVSPLISKEAKVAGFYNKTK